MRLSNKMSSALIMFLLQHVVSKGYQNACMDSLEIGSLVLEKHLAIRKSGELGAITIPIDFEPVNKEKES